MCLKCVIDDFKNVMLFYIRSLEINVYEMTNAPHVWNTWHTHADMYCYFKFGATIQLYYVYYMNDAWKK